jgi:DNA-binding CsgD family transcriptional regulator
LLRAAARAFDAIFQTHRVDAEFNLTASAGVGTGTTSEVADRLHRSNITVESHHRKIKDKFGLKTADDLTRAAVQWALENG